MEEVVHPGHGDSPVRVLMIVPKYPPPVVGGLEKQAHELSKALVGLGARVLALSGKTVPTQPSSHVVDGVPVHRFPYRHGLGLVSTFLHVTTKMFQLRRKYDIVHIHNVSWIGAICILVAKCLRKAVIIKLPNVGRRGLAGAQRRFFGQAWLWAFKKADAVVAMAAASTQELDAISYPSDHIFKTTNGVSVQGARHQARAGGSDELTVIFTGRLSPEKGLVDLLAIWSEVCLGVSRPVRLVICGGGPQEAELRMLTVSSGIGDSVSFVGFVANIEERLRQADLLVLPSYSEGNSNSILEAMALGVPVVSTRVGGTEMMVGPLGQRWLVQPGDRDGLKERIISLLNNSSDREDLGRYLAQRANNHFLTDKVAARYYEVYKHLAAGRSAQVGSVSSPVFEEPTGG